MASVRHWRQLATGLLALLGCAFCAGQVAAQQATEQAVKAGFIYNFVKFTQWAQPHDHQASPLQICTPGTHALDGQFARLDGRTIGTRVIEVRSNVAAGDWRNCDVMFVAAGDADRMETIFRSLGSAPVLTVGDCPDFVKAGGMIGLRMEDNRVRFDVNLTSTQRAGLTLNSQMIKLAGQVFK
jgi:hypothetical protein